MSYRHVRGRLPRMARRTRWRRVRDFIWALLRAILVVGAAFGPSTPPPPPPPPQTTEVKEDGDSSDELP